MVELWSYEPRVEGSTPSFSIFAFFFFELITELNKLDAETKNKTLLKAIEYYYYSKKLSKSKDGKKKDNKGIKLIKTFIKNMYYLYGKIKGKKDE